MKLELKHLAAYLPYNLKGIYHESIITLSLNGFSSSTEIGYDISLFLKCEIKPILRPLSDLDKEITHDGETFNPKFIIDMAFPSERMGLNPATWSHRVVTKLQEWHFDVFGLIEKGLAININTLKS
jgi:hypothetical protein